MPWEEIGDCGDGQMPHDRAWTVFQLETGIAYVKHVCGEPPLGCELGVMWHEHDLGEYPSVGLQWGEGGEALEPPWDYIRKCAAALAAFDNAVQWSEIHPELVREQFEGDDDDDGDDQHDGDDEDDGDEGDE